MRPIALLAFLLTGSVVGPACDVPGEPLGIEGATLLEIRAELPFETALPPSGSTSNDQDVLLPFTVPLPVDVPTSLELRGRKKDARRLREYRDKIVAIVLDSVEYEVRDPNRLPVQVDPVSIYVAPFGTLVPNALAREIGATAVIAPFEVVPWRALELRGTGLSDGSEYLDELNFTLIFDGVLRVPRGTAVPGGALKARIRLRLHARLDLAG
jgi:hypothetical protein